MNFFNYVIFEEASVLSVDNNYDVKYSQIIKQN